MQRKDKESGCLKRKTQMDYKKGVRMTENTMGAIAIRDATIGAVNEKAIN